MLIRVLFVPSVPLYSPSTLRPRISSQLAQPRTHAFFHCVSLSPPCLSSCTADKLCFPYLSMFLKTLYSLEFILRMQLQLKNVLLAYSEQLQYSAVFAGILEQLQHSAVFAGIFRTTVAFCCFWWHIRNNCSILLFLLAYSEQLQHSAVLFIYSFAQFYSGHCWLIKSSRDLKPYDEISRLFHDNKNRRQVQFVFGTLF